MIKHDHTLLLCYHELPVSHVKHNNIFRAFCRIACFTRMTIIQLDSHIISQKQSLLIL